MRSRYVAYVERDAAYLRASWHASTRPSRIHFEDARAWLGLKIHDVVAGGEQDDEGQVEFTARYKDDAKALEENQDYIDNTVQKTTEKKLREILTAEQYEKYKISLNK